MWKVMTGPIVDTLAHIFHDREFGISRDALKIAYVVRMYVSISEVYQTNSTFSISAKIFEKIFNNWALSFITKNKILLTIQLRFIKKTKDTFNYFY